MPSTWSSWGFFPISRRTQAHIFLLLTFPWIDFSCVLVGQNTAEDQRHNISLVAAKLGRRGCSVSSWVSECVDLYATWTLPPEYTCLKMEFSSVHVVWISRKTRNPWSRYCQLLAHAGCRLRFRLMSKTLQISSLNVFARFYSATLWLRGICCRHVPICPS